jgi:hypothetical protein
MQAAITWATIVRTAAETRRAFSQNLGLFMRVTLPEGSSPSPLLSLQFYVDFLRR